MADMPRPSLTGAHDHRNTLVERFFIKKRILIINSRVAEIDEGLPITKIVTPNDLLQYRLQFSEEQFSKYLNRLQQECTGYFYIHNKNAVGMIWVNHPSREVWFDSAPTLPGEARAVGTYIHPDYRGKNIAVSLRRFLVNDMNLRGINKVWGIAEAANNRSQAYNKKVGIDRIETNWLLKLFGINIISVISGKPFILFRSRRNTL